MRYFLVGIFAIFTLSAHAAEALRYSVSGNQLYSNCTSTNDAQAACMGFTTGSADQLSLDSKICASAEVTRGQIMDIVKTYLERNPELRHYPAAMLASAALRQALPCAK